MERFISPYENQYITITGTNESNNAPTTMRVRNFEPNTPRRRSANSFRQIAKQNERKRYKQEKDQRRERREYYDLLIVSRA